MVIPSLVAEPSPLCAYNRASLQPWTHNEHEGILVWVFSYQTSELLLLWALDDHDYELNAHKTMNVTLYRVCPGTAPHQKLFD